MGKIRRSNYIFITWKGEHSPIHVHIYKDAKLVLKWDLDNNKAMQGKPTKKVLTLIRTLQEEGLL
jgi:hypothetical protein